MLDGHTTFVATDPEHSHGILSKYYERKVDNETLLLVTPDALLEELALLSSASIEIAPTVFVEVIAVKNLLRCFCHFFAFSFADEVTVVRKGGRGSLRQRVSNA